MPRRKSDPFERIAVRYAAVQEEAAEIGRRLIAEELKALQRRFKRHRFTFTQGMGVRFVNVELGSVYLFGTWNSFGDVSEIWSVGGNPMRFKAMCDFADAIERILSIADRVEEDFDALIGDVGEAEPSRQPAPAADA
jgi:hypothetical protein